MMKKVFIFPILLLLTTTFVSAVFEGFTGIGEKSVLHIQAVPIAESQDLIEKSIGEGSSKSLWNALGINFYKELNIVSKGTNLNNNDEVCVGDVLSTKNVKIQGEWFNKGGPWDTPPMLFVDNLTEVVNQINSKNYTTKTYPTLVCSWFPGYIEPDNCVVEGQVICESNCIFEVEGAEENGNKITISKEGPAGVKTVCEPRCVMFIDRGRKQEEQQNESIEQDWESKIRENLISSLSGGRSPDSFEPAYGYMSLCEAVSIKETNQVGSCRLSNGFSKRGDTFSSGNYNWKGESKDIKLEKKFTFSAKPSSKGPEIQLKPYLPENPSSRFIARLGVENIGDARAYIDKIEVTNTGFKVLYSPEKIEPEEKTEILLEIMPANNGDISFKIEYSSETLGCLTQKDFSASASLKAGTDIKSICTSDTDCSIGETCCIGSCRPSSKGVCDDIDGDGEPDTWVEV
jgi:hypothetical protein